MNAIASSANRPLNWRAAAPVTRAVPTSPVSARRPRRSLERDIAGDPDFRNVPKDWVATAEAVTPTPKRLLSLRIDGDIVAWFKLQGPG